MARIEWIGHRLENWALWKSREASGTLGFGTQSSFMRDAHQGGYREAVVPIDDVDASVTDQAVESLKPDKAHLHATLHHIYVRGLGIKETARTLSKGESTIKAHLDQADHALSAWFADRLQRQRDRRESLWVQR